MTRISAAEAAHRLGIRIETVYAYVSRGYLTSHREPGRRSTFDLTEVESLRDSGVRERARRSRPFRFPAITTRLTATGDGRLRYRGHDALDLARTHSLEQVAGLLWTGRLDPQPARAPRVILAAVRGLLAATPGTVDTGSRIRLAVTVAGAADPRRLDLSPPAVIRAGSTALACMLAAVPGGDPDRDAEDESIVGRLWQRLAAPEADPRLRPCLQTALVLLADHGLAASTVAARAAASARAHPYAVIGAGLASLEGPLHGATDAAAHRMLRHADLDGPVADVLAHHRQPDGRVPGLSDRTPPDPRATALLAALRGCGAAEPVLATAAAIQEFADPDHVLAPTVELALGALATAAGMAEGATDLITGIARSVGWIAHALEEYDEPPLRWRAREIYTGPVSPG